MPQSPFCPQAQSWQALLTTHLPPQDEERWERHLESCPACREQLERIAADGDELLAVARQLGDPTAAPPDPAMSQLLEGLREGGFPGRGPLAEPADLYFLEGSARPGLLGTLGGYEVLEVIGEGGMGVVLRAYEPALHRPVAIKVLAPALAGSATARRRFTREARAAAAVCHEHVVAVHGVHEGAGLPYLVMQYVAGGSLQDRLDRDGPLKVAEVVRVGLQTASGLAAAHRQGLVHRDIKPANLLLDGGAGVKITDFGLARMADDAQLTQAGVVAGTPEYMAPEQARGEPADHRSDLFSLGSVLYACCAGSAPFRGPTTLAVLRAVGEGAPAPLRSLNPGVPAWLESLIARLMAKEPGQRCQSAAEVAALLEGYLAHLRQPAAIPAPALPPAAGRPTPARSSRVALLLAAALAVVGGASALWLLGLGGPVQGLAPDAAADPSVVWSVAISPDGKTVAAGSGWWTTAGEVGVWDLATHKPLRRFAENLGVVSVAFSLDGKLLAFSGWTHRARVVDWADGKERCDFAMNGLAHVAFSPDGSLLATASEGQNLQLWGVAGGELETDLEGDLLRFHRVTFTPDGKRLVACGGDWKPGGVSHAGVWDVATRKQVLKLAGHGNTVFCVACSPDGRTIATGSIDRTICIWDAETGRLRRTLRGPMREVDCLAFTADGKALLSSGPEPVIRLWDHEQGRETGQLDVGILRVNAFALAADDRTLVVGGTKKTLKVFDRETRRPVAVLWGGADQQGMDALPASEARPEEAARSYTSIVILALALVTAVAVGLAGWALARRRRGVGPAPEPAPAAGPAAEQQPEAARITFACAACGTKLEVRGALAGRKVKCSRCAQAVRVPPIQAGETN